MLAHVLNQYDVDIAALSETRLPGEDSLTEVGEGFTFYWKGYEENVRRIHGVGFAIRTKLLEKVTESPTGISPRLMTWRIPLAKHRYITLISAYAPTLDSSEEQKDAFYESLHSTLTAIPKEDKILLLGDFNARVGKQAHLWPRVIGKHGVGKMNNNGLRLLTLCSELNLVVTNTTFQLKNRYKTTWTHPRSKHGHMIDFIITKQSDQKDVRITRAMKGAECSTDHTMLLCKLNLRIRPPVQRTRPSKKLNLSCLKDPRKLDAFRNLIYVNLTQDNGPPTASSDDIWTNIHSTLKQCAEETLGFKTRHHKDWFDENAEDIQKILSQKNKAHDAWLSNPNSTQLKQTFQNLRKETQLKLRDMENKWWINQAKDLQNLADSNDQHGFYNGLKAIYGPQKRNLVPVRSQEGNLLKDKSAILNRWAQHFQTLLNHKNPTTPNILDEIPLAPLANEMDVPPTFKETTDAIKSLKNNKAPGPDGLPSELYKEGGYFLHLKIHELILLIWNSEIVPAEFLKSDIITIYKKKGDRAHCENSRGISLLVVASKILTRIMMIRLCQHISESTLPETQCGFRKDRSTCDMIFCARQLQEKCNEQNKDLYIAFIDLQKAFDTVNRELLWTVLEKFGTPPKFLTILKKLHENMSATVLASGERSPPFNIEVGVKQGCVIAPVIFNIFISAITILSQRAIPMEDKVAIQFRLDGSLFNLRRLQAHTKTVTKHILELQYADDCALVAHTPQALQRSLNVVAGLYEAMGLKMNVSKTEILIQRKNPEPHLTFYINGDEIKQVTNFKYLGSIVSDKHSIDEEICNRINQASAAFGKLRSRVFLNDNLRLDTKIAVYTAVCISTLLYSAETWTAYRKHIKQLEAFHISSLQKILKLSWKDKIPHTEILQRAGTTTIETMLAKKQLRWTGHIIRMSDDRLPRQILYGQLPQGHRKQGAPMKRYKDQIKTTLKRCRIDPQALEGKAIDRPAWRSTCKEGLSHLEESIFNEREARRQRRHNPTVQQPNNPGIECHLCGRVCASRIGLHSHLRWHRRQQP